MLNLKCKSAPLCLLHTTNISVFLLSLTQTISPQLSKASPALQPSIPRVACLPTLLATRPSPIPCWALNTLQRPLVRIRWLQPRHPDQRRPSHQADLHRRRWGSSPGLRVGQRAVTCHATTKTQQQPPCYWAYDSISQLLSCQVFGVYNDIRYT